MLDSVKPQFYDYLMRMTGQVNFSAETVEDVAFTFTNSAKLPDTWPDFRAAVFSTGRRISREHWNADTALLENPSIHSSEIPATDLAYALTQVDKAMRGLEGPLREAALLRFLYGFSPAKAAKIAGANAEQFSLRTDEAIVAIAASAGKKAPEVRSLIAKVPLHPMPERHSGVTQDLSLVMEGIQQAPSGIRSPLRIALMVLILVSVGLWLFWPEAFAQLISSIIGFLE